MIKLLRMAFIVILASGLTACDKKGGEKPSDSKVLNSVASFTWEEKLFDQAEIKIVNKFGDPIVGADILIGDAQGNPFRGNYIKTDSRGIAVVPSEWTGPASVTVSAQGYIRQTLLDQAPGNISIRMNNAYLPQYAEVRGKVNNLPVKDKDKLVDFALAMPMLGKSDLIYFDFDQVISPFTDTISAAGQELSVPSNVSLPKQTENYIIDVTLEKPTYRLKVPNLGPKKFIATRGNFVFKTVVKELRAGKAFHEVLNYFSILGGGVKDAVLANPIGPIDLVGNELNFSSQVQVKGIPAQADEVALALATSELSGQMIPTDVKRTNAADALKLQVLPNQPVHIINVLKKQSEFMTGTPNSDRMSASLMPIAATATNKLLPLMSNPSISTKDQYIVTPAKISPVAGITPLAVVAIISDLAEVREGGKTIMTPIRKWEVIGYGWNNQLKLPKWPLDASTSRKRVEVKYIGSATSNAQNTLDFATHFTHASADF